MYSGVGLSTEASPLHWVYANPSSKSAQLVRGEVRIRLRYAWMDKPRQATHTNISSSHMNTGYLQNSDVLESGEVTLGDACEVIPIQLPAKTDTQTRVNYSSSFAL